MDFLGIKRADEGASANARDGILEALHCAIAFLECSGMLRRLFSMKRNFSLGSAL
jgi:hypothetical protein